MSDELGSYKIQLEQVEVALAAEPSNQDLLKLKEDLEELIRLQQELDESSGKQAESSSRKVQKYDESNHRWKVGDRCMARNKNGNKQVATIDGISQDKAAISFSNGSKDVVKLSDLSAAPVVEHKNYVFESNSANKGDAKKDWRQEKERRKGMKRVPATGSSADGPKGGSKSNAATVSSRTGGTFGFTNRGNMDSLF
ncbi:hypothetical protein FO519_005559 [Halicephalobus sp. NKZ332]|nr:hypothetical protein FO519_005559 [Halicephalobus sp. NKZ332]